MYEYGMKFYEENDANEEEIEEYEEEEEYIQNEPELKIHSSVNKVKAVKYLKMAADTGNDDALNNYALFLKKGEGCSANKEEAIKYFKMAIDECKKLERMTIIPCTEKRIEYTEKYDTLIWAKPTITTANIPSFIKTIRDSAFKGCSSLAQITIPSSVTSIGWNAFNGCSSLTQITIPSSITEIGDSAFKGCSSLMQITIPSSVTEIGDDAFSGCLLLSLKQ